jgi:hypothetical protein
MRVDVSTYPGGRAVAAVIDSANPFPGADDPAWTQRMADALQTYTGWPADVACDVAAFVVHPKSYLTREPSGGYRLKDGVVSDRKYESGAIHFFLDVEVHGFMGSPTEFNERIRSSFSAPAATGAIGLRLPHLETVVSEDDGKPLALLVTTETAKEDDARELLDATSKAMTRHNGRRTWDLAAELLLHGQAEPTMHAVVQRRIFDENGDILEVTDLMAVIGNNRSEARQQNLGIAGGTQLGFAPAVVGWNPSAADADLHYYRAADWAPKMADLLRKAWEPVPDTQLHDTTRRKAFDLAREGHQLATVRAQIVLKVTQADGETPVREFERVVWEPNRTSHRRQPLEYDPHDRATAEIRALASAYVDRNLLEPDIAEWLAGDAPVPDRLMPEGDKIALADVRDLRDLRLWGIVFPVDAARAAVVQQTLGEPPLYQTRAEHVRQRLRLVAAAMSVGYPGEPWNEQIHDGLLKSSAIRTKWSPSLSTATELLSRARQPTDAGTAALDEFITTRGLSWLAHHEIVFADRGSIGKGEKTKGLYRRTSVNMRQALLRNPVMARGLFIEIRRAAGIVGTLRKRVRQVDENGKAIVGTVADALWFQENFPKTNRRGGSSGEPGPTRLKKETKAEILTRKREEFVDLAYASLPTAMAEMFSSARGLATAALAAGTPAFANEADEVVASELSNLFDAVRRDARSLGQMLTELEDEDAQLDMKCLSAAFIHETADDDDDDDDEDGEVEDEE